MFQEVKEDFESMMVRNYQGYKQAGTKQNQ